MNRVSLGVPWPPGLRVAAWRPAGVAHLHTTHTSCRRATCRWPGIAAWLMAGVLALAGCGAPEDAPTVVVYTSVDLPYAEPVLQAFERETGIAVRAVYDVEAAKTTGLATRIRAEARRPRADVFWNGEFVQTLMLAEEGLLAVSAPRDPAPIPETLRDPEGRWFALAGRARLLLVNRERVADTERPQSLSDLLDDRWPGPQVGMAHPLFGTTLTHAAALYALWGEARARAFFTRIAERKVRILPGNAAVRDLVANGTLLWGVTDTDDAAGALARKAPVAALFPDQDEAQSGTLFVPGTVARVAGAPHPDTGLLLLEYLLSPEVETRLLAAGWCHVPLRTSATPGRHLDASDVRFASIDLQDIHRALDAARADLRRIFVR